MKKIRIFDRSLYIEALRQLRTIGVVSGVLFLLQSVLVPLYTFVIGNGQSWTSEEIIELPFVGVAPLLVLIALLMPVMANILFSFINHRNASDFYHSLPVRRETMFITYLAAIFTWCLGLFIVPAVLEYVFFLPMSFVKLDMSLAGYMFVDTMVIGLLLTSVVVIAKCVTGTRFGTFAVICMILFLPRLYLTYIQKMVEYIHNFVILNNGHNIFWDYSWNLLLGIFESYKEVRSIIYTLVLSLIYFVIAGVLFVKRKSEKAESVSISSRLQLILRLLPALTFSMLPIYYILSLVYTDEYMTGDEFVIFVILYIIAIVIYFLYELLTTRKLRSVVKAAPGLLWLAAANIAMILFIKCYGDYQAQICPTAEEITSVSFMFNDHYNYGNLFDILPSYYNEVAADIEFEDDELVEIIAEQLEKTQEQDSPYMENGKVLNVKIQYNSKTICRRIGIEDIDLLIDRVLEDEHFYRFSDVFPEYDAQTCQLSLRNQTGYTGDDLHFTDDQLIKIYNQALEELALLDNAAQYELLSQYKEFLQYLYISFNYKETKYTNLYIPVNKQLLPKTWKLIQDYS